MSQINTKEFNTTLSIDSLLSRFFKDTKPFLLQSVEIKRLTKLIKYYFMSPKQKRIRNIKQTKFNYYEFDRSYMFNDIEVVVQNKDSYIATGLYCFLNNSFDIPRYDYVESFLQKKHLDKYQAFKICMDQTCLDDYYQDNLADMTDIIKDYKYYDNRSDLGRKLDLFLNCVEEIFLPLINYINKLFKHIINKHIYKLKIFSRCNQIFTRQIKEYEIPNMDYLLSFEPCKDSLPYNYEQIREEIIYLTDKYSNCVKWIKTLK